MIKIKRKKRSVKYHLILAVDTGGGNCQIEFDGGGKFQAEDIVTPDTIKAAYMPLKCPKDYCVFLVCDCDEN